MKRLAFLFVTLIASSSAWANNLLECDCPTSPEEIPELAQREAANWSAEEDVLWGVRTNCYEASGKYFFSTPTKISMELNRQKEGIYEVAPFLSFEFPEEKSLSYSGVLRILGDSIQERFGDSTHAPTRGVWKFCGRLKKGQMVLGGLSQEALNAEGGDACGCQYLDDEAWIPSWIHRQKGSPEFRVWGLRTDCNPGV